MKHKVYFHVPVHLFSSNLEETPSAFLIHFPMLIFPIEAVTSLSNNVQINPLQYKTRYYDAERQDCGTLSHGSFIRQFNNQEIVYCDFILEELTLQI